MRNIRLTIQYDGSRYNGWQRQGNTENTIQGKIEHVLGEMVGHRVEIHGAGRTDAGVHALAQVASCKIETEKGEEEIQNYCNQYLPQDIAITQCDFMPERFHARLNATGKRYVYRIWTGDVPNVFERKYLCALPQKLNVDKMQEAAAYLIGTHDFKAFCSLKRFKKSTVRTIQKIDITAGDEVRLSFEGDGFLYNMVRILTGTLVEVGEGLRKPEDMLYILNSLDRAQAGRTMPPQGLRLEQVYYTR